MRNLAEFLLDKVFQIFSVFNAVKKKNVDTVDVNGHEFS